MLVYLCGPVDMIGVAAADGWRRYANKWFAAQGITALSPTAAERQFHDGDIRSAFARDFYDVQRCNVVLANLTQGAETYGTFVEFGWAYALRKPIIAAFRPSSTPSRFVQECFSATAETLGDALNLVMKFS